MLTCVALGALVTAIRSSAAALVLTGATFIMTAAFAADLPTKALTRPEPAVVPAWAGFYAGLHAGYGWGSGATDLIGVDPILFVPAQTTGVVPTSLTPRVDGFVGGGQIGYNWQFVRALVGLEADIASSGMKGNESFSSNIIPYPPMTVTQTNKVTWLGTLRTRLGWLPAPSVLIYASGGLAYGGVKASTSMNVDNLPPPLNCPTGNVFCATGSLSGTRVGWTVGGGVEAFIASHWSMRMDYLYFDLGQESYPIVSTATFGVGGTEVMRGKATFNGHIVRAGLNYHF